MVVPRCLRYRKQSAFLTMTACGAALLFLYVSLASLGPLVPPASTFSLVPRDPSDPGLDPQGVHRGGGRSGVPTAVYHHRVLQNSRAVENVDWAVDRGRSPRPQLSPPHPPGSSRTGGGRSATESDSARRPSHGLHGVGASARSRPRFSGAWDYRGEGEGGGFHELANGVGAKAGRLPEVPVAGGAPDSGARLLRVPGRGGDAHPERAAAMSAGVVDDRGQQEGAVVSRPGSMADFADSFHQVPDRTVTFHIVPSPLGAGDAETSAAAAGDGAEVPDSAWEEDEDDASAKIDMAAARNGQVDTADLHDRNNESHMNNDVVVAGDDRGPAGDAERRGGRGRTSSPPAAQGPWQKSAGRAALKSESFNGGRQALASDNTIYVDEEGEGEGEEYQFEGPHLLGPQNAARRLPQALIIGVKKAGTRALLEFLRIHPDVRAPGPEPHFFDKHYQLGLDWYRQQMPATVEGQLTIEKTPSYFVTREVPKRIFNMSKAMKLIVVVRDPVVRAISDYTQAASKRPDIPPFEQMAFIDNSTRLVDTKWGAVRIGVYAKHLERWLRYFPLSQIHFVSGERLIADPAEEVGKVQDFLGLERLVNEKHFYLNETRGFPCIIKPGGNGRPHCLGKTKGRTHPDVHPDVLKRLRDFFRPFNLKFYQMAKQDFGWT